jgi:flagellar hook-basal body complex protein FliE
MAIAAVGALGQLPVAGGMPITPPAEGGTVSFARVVNNLLGDLNAQQARADQAVQDLALGRTDSLHDVMLSVAKADLGFRLVLELRNRLSDAYQQIMQMQV